MSGNKLLQSRGQFRFFYCDCASCAKNECESMRERCAGSVEIFLHASLKIYGKFDVLSFMVIRVTCRTFYVEFNNKKNIAYRFTKMLRTRLSNI